jgi:hypothetical protein
MKDRGARAAEARGHFAGAVVFGATLVLVAGMSARVVAMAAESAPPHLAGIWKLDTTQSETLQQKMEEMRGSGGRPSGGGPGGGGPGGGMGGSPPGGGGRGMRGGSGGPTSGAMPDGESFGGARPGEADDPVMNSLARPPLTMLIEDVDTALVLSERGRTLKQLALKAGAKADTTRGSVTLVAKWKGKRLQADGVTRRGGKVRETYELAQDGRQLIVVTRVEMREGMPALELKRVYQRYEGD